MEQIWNRTNEYIFEYFCGLLLLLNLFVQQFSHFHFIFKIKFNQRTEYTI